MEFRYIITVENEKHFIEHKFEKERIVKSSQSKWYALNNQARSDYVKVITRTAMQLNDDYMGFSKDEESGFFKTSQPTRAMPYPNTFQNAITYEVSLDQRFYYRQVYTSLDFLSETGGLFTALSRLCLVIITGLNYFGSF